MSSVNLSKVIGMLENQDKKLDNYKSTENCIEQVLSTMKKMQKESIVHAYKKASEENRIKIKAVANLHSLRAEFDTLHKDRSEGGEVYWRE